MAEANFVLFAGIGALSGFFAGLLGLGGGAIITPLLIITLANVMPPSIATHAAIGSSLAVIVLTSIPSVLTHARHGAVSWRIGALLAGGAALGAFTGANIAGYIPAAVLNLMLSFFLFRISFYMFRSRRTDLHAESSVSSPPKLVGVGACIGGLSSMLGIGGGAMSVPFLFKQKLPMRKCIGTSSFINIPVAVFAVAGYIIGGWNHEDMPAGSWGYVYTPALAGIAVFSMIFAVVGATLTANLPEFLLRRIFGGIAAILALRLLAATIWAVWPQ